MEFNNLNSYCLMKKSYFLLLSVALFALAACTTPTGNGNDDDIENNSTKNEYDLVIDNLMEGCKNFDRDKLTNMLPGQWIEDSYLSYDDEWKTITKAWLIMGDMNCEGLSCTHYVFTSDGKGSYSFTPEYPPFEEIVVSFDWQYDAKNSTLTFSKEGYSLQYNVSGFSKEYIVLDYFDTTNNDNKRLILKALAGAGDN